MSEFDSTPSREECGTSLMSEGNSISKENCCIKCKEPSSRSKTLAVVKKGIDKIIDYSKKVSNQELTTTIIEKQKSGEDIHIHRQCQKDIYNEMKRKTATPITSSVKVPKVAVTRSKLPIFDWKQLCLICGEQCIENSNNRNKKIDWRLVQVLQVKKTLLDICSMRTDQLALDVQRRLLKCSDLVAEEARYHIKCRENFKPLSSSTPGRPLAQEKEFYFNEVCEWLESEVEVYSLPEIHQKMMDLSMAKVDVYSPKWLKFKLLKRYGTHIRFIENEGKPNMVCFQNMADYLITDKWYLDRKINCQDETKRIVILAAKLIKDNIRATNYSCDFYPNKESIDNIETGKKWLPLYLRILLEHILKDPLKQASIGQALVNASRPRSCISPILFGLGVEMDHKFGSRWLISELNRLGFSVSTDEVTRFKQSVFENDSIELDIGTHGSFTQYSADNVDHNVRTIDGKGSLHGMGIISSTTSSGSSFPSTLPPIKRQKLKKVTDLIRHKGISIKTYIPYDTTGLSKLIYKPVNSLNIPIKLPMDIGLDFLWHTSILLKNGDSRPSWSGYMTNVTAGEYPGKSTISFLPIIDLDPNDMSCVFTTLSFVIEQAKILNLNTPVLTFDQPLWLKATEIANARNMNIVLILGGFHLMMSFMGSIGKLMKGSGIEEALGTVYGSNAIEHILSGKAVARAIRGHFLISSALTTKLISKFFPQSTTMEELENFDQETAFSSEIDHEETLTPNDQELDEDFQKLTIAQVEKLSSLTQQIHAQPNQISQLLLDSEELKILDKHYKTYCQELAQRSRTAKFWLQYLKYVNILKLFIRAERTGNWNLHLNAMSQMLNIFAATGHNNYAKCARLHLQNMLELETKYSWVYTNFSELGYHTVRRTDRFWAGLWSDLIIEQVLMRALKTRGGLTRGRGVTESVRLLWLKTMHRFADVHNSMGQLTGVLHKTSEQHVELGASRIKKDHIDLKKINEWFNYHNPFVSNDPTLHSLSTGLTATEKVNLNCDEAEAVGRAIQQQFDGISLVNVKIRRKDQVTTFENLRPGIKLDKKSVNIDPLILFSRLIAIIQREGCVVDQFCYELTPEPASLFKDGMMRKSEKSVLRNHLLDKVESEKVGNVAECCVVDGGALLHKVKWLSNSSFEDVAITYVEYMKHRYGQYANIYVVFDGYSDDLSIKTNEHTRRGCQMACANIAISKFMTVTSQREIFLKNSSNKTQFIDLLSVYLQEAGIEVVHSIGDADVLIVKTALQIAANKQVVISAQDTDVLVLLIHHWSPFLKDMYFQTERKEKSNTVLKQWNIHKIIDQHDLANHLLFAHAWSGCDTTSSIHRQGKMKILQLLRSPLVQDTAEKFGNLNSTQECIGQCGFHLALKSYGGKCDETLTSLRYTKFMEVITTSFSMKPENLPPTERAIYFHALRVHLQVSQWKTLDLQCLNPLEWGWYQDDDHLKPIKTDLEPAPEFLLKFIRCNCKLTSKNACGSNVCTCRRNGLKCLVACGDCQGENCKNAKECIIYNEEDESMDESDFDRNIFALFD